MRREELGFGYRGSLEFEVWGLGNRLGFGVWNYPLYTSYPKL